jgi:hypothetical protein
MLPKTQPKLPLENRPKAVTTFFKNVHSYKKDYGLEIDTLGADIMGWWEVVKSTGDVVGGPTGMYTFVVLMSWWCSLLERQPSRDRSDYLRTLEDIDRALLSALHNTTSPPRTPATPPTTPTTPAAPPTTSTTRPAPRPRGTKRASSEESSSRKRLRSAQA